MLAEVLLLGPLALLPSPSPASAHLGLQARLCCRHACLRIGRSTGHAGDAASNLSQAGLAIGSLGRDPPGLHGGAMAGQAPIFEWQVKVCKAVGVRATQVLLPLTCASAAAAWVAATSQLVIRRASVWRPS